MAAVYLTLASPRFAQSSVSFFNTVGQLWRAASGHSGAAVPQLGHSRGYKQQDSGVELQAVGEPSQTQRPAEGGAHVGQTLLADLPLRLSQGFVRVDDVQACTAKSQQTWR